MLNIQLARKYSTAIFEIAQEEQKLGEYGKELAQVCEELFSVPGAREFFQNPQVQPKAKKELITKLFAQELSTVIYHFLMLLVDKRRIALLEAIEEGYRALSNKARGIVIADVTTAGEMAAAQQESLREKLASVTGKKVQLRMHTDESLIGGVVVKIGDKRIDGSVQGRLAALSKELMANK